MRKALSPVGKQGDNEPRAPGSYGGHTAELLRLTLEDLKHEAWFEGALITDLSWSTAERLRNILRTHAPECMRSETLLKLIRDLQAQLLADAALDREHAALACLEFELAWRN